MYLRYKVKPQVVIAITKEELIRKVTQGYAPTIGGNKRFYYKCNSMDKFFGSGVNSLRVFNLIKVRKRVERTRKKDKTTSKVVSSRHWKAYVYTFETSVLQAIGVKRIEQHLRNFTMEFHK